MKSCLQVFGSADLDQESSRKGYEDALSLHAVAKIDLVVVQLFIEDLYYLHSRTETL